MAWQARLTNIGSAGDKVQASFDFFDDQAPVDPKTSRPTVTWVDTFTFDPLWTAAQMQATVVARGKQVRDAKVRADALAGQFPLDTTVIAIP
jgi:hypothetical protein